MKSLTAWEQYNMASYGDAANDDGERDTKPAPGAGTDPQYLEEERRSYWWVFEQALDLAQNLLIKEKATSKQWRK